MRVHRFMSDKEYRNLMMGCVMQNDTVHAAEGKHTDSVGFCFFSEKPDDAIHWLSGQVDVDWCVTFEVNPACLTDSWGEYSKGYGSFEMVRRTEYCTTTYSKRDFKIINATSKFKGKYPSKAEAEQLLYTLFGLKPTKA